MRAVLATAAELFRSLRVRTESAAARELYERLGFERVGETNDCSHVIMLPLIGDVVRIAANE